MANGASGGMSRVVGIGVFFDECLDGMVLDCMLVTEM